MIYYISSSEGNDNFSGAINSPLKTLSKISNLPLQPGDSILFRRGDTFYGCITINKSGTSTQPIVFGAYGEGDNPIITGLTPVTEWVSKGGNIYESVAITNATDWLDLVTKNGNIIARGRYPNSGYLTFEKINSFNSITDNELDSSVNWTGAHIVLRTNRWVMDRWPITNHSGNTINFVGGITALKPNYGYFITNSPKTLDAQDEWYYNPNTRKLLMYSVGIPQNIKVSTQEFCVNSYNKSYVRFANLTFEGGGEATINFKGGTQNVIENCIVNNSGNTGIKTFLTTYFRVDRTLIENSLNNGVDFTYGSEFAILRNSEIRNTSTIAGMGQGGEAKGLAVNIRGQGSIVENNKILNSGFIAIEFSAEDNIIIRYNVIDTYCFVKDDGGGIYTWTGGSSRVTNKGRVISNNIIKNGTGAVEGTSGTGLFANSAFGIYTDVNSSDIIISDNYLENCGRAAIYLRPLANNIQVLRNTLLNTQYLLFVIRDGERDCYNNVVKNNIFFSSEPLQIKFDNYKDSRLPSVGAIDENTYVNRSNKTFIFSIKSNKYNFSQWKIITNFDDNSLQRILSSTDVVKTVSTAEESLIVDLGNYEWKNLNGEVFVNPLQPYSSAVLIRGEEIKTDNPVVTILSDKTVYSYPETIFLFATVENLDKEIVKVEFLFNGKHLYTDTVFPWGSIWKNALRGNYVFTAIATDSSGKTFSSGNSVYVTVQ